MKTAPPTLPGRPANRSRPAMPRIWHQSVRSRMEAPHSACTRRESPLWTLGPEISANRARETTRPLMPRSETRTFDPPPNRETGISRTAQRSRRNTRDSIESGSANISAGPPTLNVVWARKGSSNRIFPDKEGYSSVILLFSHNFRTVLMVSQYTKDRH